MKQHFHFGGHLPPAKRTRALPLADSDHREWMSSPHEHDSHASITHAVIVFSSLCCRLPKYSVPFFSQRPEQIKQQCFHSTSDEPWWPASFRNYFIWWPSEKSWDSSEAIKQSADWDHPTNAPYLFNKLSPRGPVLVEFTKSDGDTPSPWPWPPKDVKLQVTISPWQATDLLFFPLMIHLHSSSVHGHYLLKASIPTSLLGIVNDSVAFARVPVPLVQSNHWGMLQAIAHGHGPPGTSCCTCCLLQAKCGLVRSLLLPFAGFVGEFLR